MNECTPISRTITDAAKLAEASGLPYRLTPSTISVKGEWDELFLLIRKCHERVRALTPHVMTTISIEDEDGLMDKIEDGSRAIEEKITNPATGWKPKIRNIKPSKNQI
jgi:uncharacterized protein YqgV (UPF0045/DUF77 family)